MINFGNVISFKGNFMLICFTFCVYTVFYDISFTVKDKYGGEAEEDSESSSSESEDDDAEV